MIDFRDDGSGHLDAEALFRLACVDVYQDWKVDPSENRFLQDLYKLLKIDGARAKTIAGEAKAAAAESGMAVQRPASPPKIFGDACSLAWADGEILADERAVLVELGKLLKLSLGEVNDLIDAARPLHRQEAPVEELHPPEPPPRPRAPHPLSEEAAKKKEAEESGGGDQPSRPREPTPPRPPPPRPPARPDPTPPPMDTGATVPALAIVGALCIGLGMVFWVASHWDDIPQFAKFLLVLGAIAAVFAGAYERCLVDGQAPATGDGLILVGGLFYGAGIGLVAQIYNIHAHFPNGFLAWALGLAPMVFVARSSPLRFLMLFTIMVWTCLEQSRPTLALPWLDWLFSARIRALNPVYWAVFFGLTLPALRTFPSSAGTTLAVFTTGLWFMVPVLVHGALAEAVTLDILVGFALLLIGLSWMARSGWKLAEGFDAGFDILAALAVFCITFPLCFGSGAQLITDGIARYYRSPTAPWPIPVLLHGLAFAVAAMLFSRMAMRPGRLPAGCLLLAAGGSALPWVVTLDPARASMVYSVVFVALALGLAFVGVLERRPGVLNLGVWAVGFWVAARAIQYLSTMRDTGLALIGGGVVLLGGAYAIERLRARLRHESTTGGGW